jgi:phosphoribosylglycinamide formyltransferase 1
MKKIVILTGNELRHQYFRLKVASAENICVLASYCESDEKSLKHRTNQNQDSSDLQKLHVIARDQAERDFFEEAVGSIEDKSKSRVISKGSINDENIVKEIKALSPDLLVCYGSSLIKSSLLNDYEGRFLNVHLGLSPYYRGSGTNVWPLINGEPFMVGATFMYIDAGIDTGKIIHQIRADFFIGDSPHSVGNRLIKKMTATYCEIIRKFDLLSDPVQLVNKGSLYLMKNFDSDACDQLYEMCQSKMIYEYLNRSTDEAYPVIVQNLVMEI